MTARSARAGWSPLTLPCRRSRVERKRARERRAVRRERRRARLGSAARGLLVAAVLFLSFLPVPFVADAIAWVPFIMVVLFLLLDRAYLAILRRRLAFDEDVMQPTCERSHRADFAVGLASSTVLPYPRVTIAFYVSDLFGAHASEREASCSLGPRESTEIRFDARFAHIGTYEAGVDRVTVHDLVGLWSSTTENARRNEVRVLPRLFDVGRVELSEVSLEESAKVFRPIAADDMDYAGVREYRPGDPLKSVHWKLSARLPGAALQTRLYEVLGNPGLEVVVDPFASDYDPDDLMHAFDGIVESALSMNAYAVGSGLDARVAYVDAHGEPASATVAGAADSEALLAKLGEVRRASSAGAGADAACALLRREGEGSRSFGNMAYVTSRVEGAALEALVEMKMRRRNPVLMLVVPRSVEGRDRDRLLAPLRRLDMARVPYYVVESTDLGTEVVGA